jgi:uncharacterized membrane protein YoaK (UPF0700 family)
MVLPAVAGAVNASGLFVVGAYTSHITGMFARFGDELAQGHWDVARESLWLVGFFLLGAVLAAIIVDRSQRLARAKYVAPLCLEAALIALVAFGAALFPSGGQTHRFILITLLCVAMGVQNALVTRISGAVVRTTHMTGVLTDLGIELVQLAAWVRARLMSWLLGQAGAGGHKPFEGKRLFFHLTILLSFGAGAVLGPLSYLNLGPLALLLPATVVLLLAYVDARIGLKVSEREARSWREATGSVSAVASTNER